MTESLNAAWSLSAPRTAPRVSAEETARDRRHPISRWYLLPLADWLAQRLARIGVGPNAVTLLGLALAIGAAAVLIVGSLPALAAALVLAAWLADRVDGKLARLSGRATSYGAWLDANLDELTDLGLHAAAACAAASATGTQLPWLLLSAFIAGKYLLVYGLPDSQGASEGVRVTPRTPPAIGSRFRQLYHLPGNADVRLHLLLAALLADLLIWELAALAVYYNLRWMVRHFLLWRRASAGGRP